MGLCCGSCLEWHEKSRSCCSGIAQLPCLDSAWEASFSGGFGDNSELLQLLQAAANKAPKIKLRAQVKTNQPLL